MPPSDVIYPDTVKKFRRNTEYQVRVPSIINTGQVSNSGSLTFLKKLFKEKITDKRVLGSDSDEGSSDCSSSPSLFRRASASMRGSISTQSNLLTVNDPDHRPRSPSPSSLFRKKLGRRSSTSNEKTNENLLHYFVSHEDYSSLHKLFSDANDSVDIDMMRPPGISALHQACALGNLKIVKLLVQKGANVRLRTMSGLSPLKVAVLSGSYEIAQYLVSAGASDDDIKNGCQIEANNGRRSKSF